MIKKLKKIVIATGGTGGHVFPAYSLAKHFIDKKIHVQITSDKRGLRYLLDINDVKKINIMSSTIDKNNIFKFLISAFIILYSFFRSFIFLLFNRPNLVFGMGGYASFPVCVAARMLGIPLKIYENNLHIGKANKYLQYAAKKIFVSFADLDGISNKHKNKICEIGNIIRKEMLNFQSKIDLSGKIRILILGGSQAAKIFGEKLPIIFEECNDAKIPFEIYQQCIPEQNEILSSFYSNLNLNYEIFNFSNNISKYFSKTNLAITRSGSSMLAELTNAKIPFISIPLPTSADNHQLKNAIHYEKNQYSYLIEEKDLDKKLFKLIKQIHEDRSLLNQIINKQKQYSDKKVYENIDREINNIFNEEN